MSLKLYAHPFSSYSQKVLIALYENATPFTYRLLGPEDPTAFSELTKLSPLNRFPVLVDADRAILESTMIIEYLQTRYAGPIRIIPDDLDAAIEVRMLDRIFDGYVMTPMQKIVGDFLRGEKGRDPSGVAEAKSNLEQIYVWLDAKLAGRNWAAGDDFGLADCAAAPSLFYADWVHPIDAKLTTLRNYRQRVLARPSVARAVDEARPYRNLFPPGAPDRD